MTVDVKEIKKGLINDWKAALPSLGVYNQSKLYNISGPLVVGLELVHVQRIEGYRPHFVIYSLWGNKIGNDLKSCLNGPVILFEILDRKGLQLNIPYLKHKVLFGEALECVKIQVGNFINNGFSLKSLFNLVDFYSNHFTVRNHSAKIAILYELKINAALYVNASQKINDVLKEIRMEKENWNMEQFKLAFNDFGRWYQELEGKAFRREEFLTLVQKNKTDKKLAGLPNFELRD